MNGDEPHQTEIIQSDRVLRRGEVTDVEAIKIKWSIIISVSALIIGALTLVAAIYFDQPALTTWATGLISAISGSALTYGFNKSN